jgi:Fe-S cluster assembly protein SufD
MARTTSTQRNEAWYVERFAGFEKSLNGATSTPPLHALRQDAIHHFSQLGFPTNADEDWRFTNLTPLGRIDFQPQSVDTPISLAGVDLAPFVFENLDCIQLVFINGRYTPSLSTQTALPDDVRIGSLANALVTDDERVEEYLGRYAPHSERAFTALNTAFVQDGAYIHLYAGAVLETPIHLLFLSTAPKAPAAFSPRNLIIAEANSQARLIETHAGINGQVYLTNAVTEIELGENAVLDHCKIQRDSDAAFHISSQVVHESRDSNYTSHVFTLGGRLTRNDLTTVLAGPGVESILNGLYVLEGEQHADNHTHIEHVQVQCNSHELYKGILADKSTASFRGRIYVHQTAQQTNAYQSNQNLLLSPDAQVNTKPQLEIYADEVKCSHGATIGQLDEDAVFYLRTRGMGPEAAARVLTRAFAGELIDRVPLDAVRQKLDQLVTAKLKFGQVAGAFA